MNEKKTAVSLSGGVDSLVAAYLLKQKIRDLIGIHFFTGFERPHFFEGSSSVLCEEFARQRASYLAGLLGISVKVVDIRKQFRETVVAYFIRAYQKGQTPNPCLVCNARVKFSTVFDLARQWGIERLATGHYAGISRDASGRYHLHKGFDSQKDQSYFLAFMTQDLLSRACFPLSETTKPDVRRIARNIGLRPACSKESQDICFIKNMTYGDFLAAQKGFEPSPGIIEDTAGNVIGEHDGLHLFTVGQRRGINCPAAEPYFVIRMDRDRNVLVVGTKPELLTETCHVTSINWIHEPPSDKIKVLTRIRYRHRAAISELFPVGKTAAAIKFETPQEALTPGQGAVFYRENEVLGGGFIEG